MRPSVPRVAEDGQELILPRHADRGVPPQSLQAPRSDVRDQEASKPFRDYADAVAKVMLVPWANLAIACAVEGQSTMINPGRLPANARGVELSPRLRFNWLIRFH